MSPGAVVLCGGASRRMGCAKAWLPFGDERMLQRVVRLAGTVARPIVVVAAEGQELPPLSADVTVVRDPVAGRGPLQGLAAGLSAFSDSIELVYATATDVPFLASRIKNGSAGSSSSMSDGHDLVIPYVGGYLHPLAALYRQSAVLPVINDLLRVEGSPPVDGAGRGTVKTRESRSFAICGTVDNKLLTLRNCEFAPRLRRQALQVMQEFTTSGQHASLEHWSPKSQHAWLICALLRSGVRRAGIFVGRGSLRAC